MTAVPEESGHTHDRRYSQRNHRHDDRYVMKPYVDGDGWVLCANGSGMTGSVYARLAGGHCQLAGALSGTMTGNPTVLTLPSTAYRPVFPSGRTYYTFLCPATNSGSYASVRVWAALTVTVAYPMSGTPPTTLAFDGCRWPVNA